MTRMWRLREERGAAAVEFALISTVLFLIGLGIIEFGATDTKYEVFVNAAREGGRRAAVRATKAEIQSAITDSAEGYTLSQTPNITVDGGVAADPPCNSTNTGHTVTVSWTQTFPISIPFLPAWSPSVLIKGAFRCE
jgi:Flp pilus assembly protein TadG